MAPSASKFEDPFNIPCGVISHPWCPDSCMKGVLMMTASSTLGCAPFVLLFTLARVLLSQTRQKHNQRDEIRQILVRILRLTMFGAGMASGIVGSMCLLRNKLGRFHNCTIGFLPGCAGGLAIFTQKHSDMRPIIDSFYLVAVEYGLRKIASSFSVNSQILGFSVVSALLSLLQHLTPTKTHIPWFHWLERRSEVTAPEIDLSSTSGCRPLWLSKLQKLARSHHPACEHEGGCLAHIADGAMKYLAVGIALSLAQGVLPRLRSLYAAKSEDIRRMPPLLRLNLPAFFSAYVTLFRISRCILSWVYNKDSALHITIAGALAGVSYIVNPSLSIFAAALASASELFWNYIAKSRLLPQFLHSCPRLVVVLSAGLMIHARIFDRNICPRVGAVFVSQCTRGRADEMLNAYFKIFGKDAS